MSLRSVLVGVVTLLVVLVAAVSATGAADDAAGPDPALAEWPEFPYRVACREITFDPMAVFSGPTNAERGSLSSERALHTVRVDVGAPCARGENLAAQAEDPVFDEIDGKLLMTVWLRPQHGGGPSFCEEDVPRGPPLVVELPGPLGNRELFDGGVFPPEPAQHLAEPKVVFGRQG
jgi:hypothetical protein